MARFKRLAKAGISCLWFAKKALVWRRYSHDRFIVIYYHACRKEHKRQFERQMQMLNGYADVVPAGYSGEAGIRPKVAITFDDAFESVIENAVPILAKFDFPCTIFVPSANLGCSPVWQMEGDAPDRSEVVATVEALRALDPKLVTLGAHSRTHPHLSQLAADRLRDEVAGSRAELERLLGRSITMFAFPYGDFNQKTLQACKDAGYCFAFSIAGQAAPIDATQLLRPRVAVDPSDSPLEFWLKIRLAYEWMATASSLKRNLIARAR